MTELSDGPQTIDAALAELSNWKQDFGEATSILSTTQWIIVAALLILAIIIGFWVGKDTEIVDESQALNSSEDQKEEGSKNELEQLRKQLKERDSELKDAKEEAELSLLQPHQAQEEREQLFLESKDAPKHEIKQLQQQLDTRNNELKEAKEEAELTLLQLHQVQEELEHYFLESREFQKKINSVHTVEPSQQKQLQRIRSKLQKMFLATPQKKQVDKAQIAAIPQLHQLLLRQQNSLRRFQAISSKKT